MSLFSKQVKKMNIQKQKKKIQSLENKLAFIKGYNAYCQDGIAFQLREDNSQQSDYFQLGFNFAVLQNSQVMEKFI